MVIGTDAVNPSGDMFDPTGASSNASGPHRITWKAVLFGTVVAVAMWMLLTLLGLAIGLTAVDVDDSRSISGAALGTGAWSVIAPLIAFFVGGLVVGHHTTAFRRIDNAIAGLVMWSIGAIGGTIILGMVLSSILGGALSAGKAAAAAAGDVAGQAAKGLTANAGKLEDLPHALGVNANDALQPVNKRLRAEGKPDVTAAQLEAAAKDVVGDAVRSGSFDKEMLVRSLAEKTALSRAEAEDIAARMQAQYESAKAKVEAKVNEAKAAAKQAAQATTDAIGKMMLGLFAALVLALVAAVGGALLGGRRDKLRASAPVEARRH